MAMNFKDLFGTQFSRESCAKMPFITEKQVVHLNIFCQLGTICRCDRQNSLPVLFQKGRLGLPKFKHLTMWPVMDNSEGKGLTVQFCFIMQVISFLNVHFDYYHLWNVFFIVRSWICYSCYSIVYKTAEGSRDICSPHATVRIPLWIIMLKPPVESYSRMKSSFFGNYTDTWLWSSKNVPWWKPGKRLPLTKVGRVCSEEHSIVYYWAINGDWEGWVPRQ